MQNNPFFSPIPLSYIRSKEIPLFFYFNIEDIIPDIVYDRVTKTVIKHVNYTVYIKVSPVSYFY